MKYEMAMRIKRLKLTKEHKSKIFTSWIVFMMILSIFSMFLVFDKETAKADTWYDETWSYRRSITIDHNYLTGTVTNFPVLITIPVAMAANCQADGGDLRFFSDEAGTAMLYYEIDTWNAAANSYVWVKVPSVSSVSNTTIYVYYGNAAVANGEDENNVWDSDYISVWHMNDLTTSSIEDSTVYNHDGAKKGANEPAVTTSGRIGDAQNFDGANDYIQIADHADYDTNAMTIDVFMKRDTSAATWGIVNKHKASVNKNTYLIKEGATHSKLGPVYYPNVGVGVTPDFYLNGTLVVTEQPVSESIWYCVGFVVSSASMGTTTFPVGLGYMECHPATSVPTLFFDGILDEIRYSKIVRSADWEKATYNSMVQSDFAVLGTEEDVPTCGYWWDGDWNYYMEITIDHNLISADLTNFPVLVVVNSTTAAKCDGGDSIRFIRNDFTTELNYEIEKWDAAGNSYVWVNITYVSSVADTVFYMFYNNTAAADDQNPTGVWDANYVAVYHMKDDTTSTYLDSTSWNNDQTKKGAGQPATTTGNVGYAEYFDGKDDYSTTADADELDLNLFTLEAYVNPDHIGNVDTEGNVIIHKNTEADATDCPYEFWLNQSNYPGIRTMAGSAWLVYNYNSTVGLSAYTYVAATHSATAFSVWENSTKGRTATVSKTISVTTTPVDIGRYFRVTTGYGFFNGTIDEVRMSNIVRSDSWITATFHSLNQTTDFILFGGETGLPSVLTISNENPTDTATGIAITIPSLSVLVNHSTGCLMTITIQMAGQVPSTWNNVANGTRTFVLTSTPLTFSTTYTWYVNVTDGIQWQNETFTFTTDINNPPSFSNPLPANGSTGVSRSTINFSIDISDTEGHTFNWTIQTSMGDNSNANGATDGTKVDPFPVFLPASTTITIWVNATDQTGLSNTSYYWFTTTANQPPVISNPSPLNTAFNKSITTNHVSAYISEPEDDYPMTYYITLVNTGETTTGGTGIDTTITLPIAGPLLYSTTYTWWVNVSDSLGAWTNQSFTFSTTVNTSDWIDLPQLNDVDMAQWGFYAWVYVLGSWFWGGFFGVLGAALFIKTENAAVTAAWFLAIGIITMAVWPMDMIYMIGILAGIILGFMFAALIIER